MRFTRKEAIGSIIALFVLIVICFVLMFYIGGKFEATETSYNKLLTQYEELEEKYTKLSNDYYYLVGTMNTEYIDVLKKD